MTAMWRLFKKRIRRIGVLTLWRHARDDRWAVSLDNRTYHHFVEIPLDRTDRWLKEFDIHVPPDRFTLR